MKVQVISLPFIFQVLYVLCFTRPRYQVSVYRTIGSLVIILIPTPDFPHFYYMFGENLGSLLYEDVSVMSNFFQKVCSVNAMEHI